MTPVADLVLLVGLFFIAAGVVGVLRLPDFYTRLHALGKSDTLGVALTVGALALRSGATLTSLKILLIVAFVTLANPTATHALGRALLKVPYLAMPNLLAGEELFPEFIQSAANADNLAEAGLRLLRNKAERTRILDGLDRVANRLGQPGAAPRAAQVILSTLE